MKKSVEQAIQWTRDTTGTAVVEYGLIAFAIALAVIFSIDSVGTALKTMFEGIGGP